MGERGEEARANERARGAGPGGGGRARLRSELPGGAAMLAGRCGGGGGDGAAPARQPRSRGVSEVFSVFFKIRLLAFGLKSPSQVASSHPCGES